MTQMATSNESERAARKMLIALDVMATMPVAQRDAERYAFRINFALTHIDELKRAADKQPALTAARIEVAEAILETHARTAAEFIERTLIDKRRGVKRRALIETVEDATAAVERFRLAA
jgi:hypothetical protein